MNPDGYTVSVFAGYTPNAEDYNLFHGINGSPGIGAHDLAVSPQFAGQPTGYVNDSSLDNFAYALTASSPAKAAGVVLAGYTTDFYGNAYAATPSIGALEYGSVVSTGTVTSPPPATA